MLSHLSSPYFPLLWVSVSQKPFFCFSHWFFCVFWNMTVRWDSGSRISSPQTLQGPFQAHSTCIRHVSGRGEGGVEWLTSQRAWVVHQWPFRHWKAENTATSFMKQGTKSLKNSWRLSGFHSVLEVGEGEVSLQLMDGWSNQDRLISRKPRRETVRPSLRLIFWTWKHCHFWEQICSCLGNVSWKCPPAPTRGTS